MADLEFGPVELFLAAFDGDAPDPGVLEAIDELVGAGTVRVIDITFVTRNEEGDVEYAEIGSTGIALDAERFVAAGIASHDDIQELGGGMPRGTSALLLVVEHLWAKHIASKLFDAGGFVVDSVRIPAPAVNAVVAEALAG